MTIEEPLRELQRMTSDARAQFIGLPNAVASDRCGYQLDLDSEYCDKPATWHVYGRSAAWGEVTCGGCTTHIRIAIAALDRLIGEHPFGENCKAPETIWSGDHCELLATGQLPPLAQHLMDKAEMERADARSFKSWEKPCTVVETRVCGYLDWCPGGCRDA